MARTQEGRHAAKRKRPISVFEVIRTYWTRGSILQVVVLSVVLILCFVTLFVFTVFSDFGGSADFAYNQF